jgi:hypothetical protein
MPITTSNSKCGVGEVHEDSDPMAERSPTVTRRVQPARGKGFCEAETLMPITTSNPKHCVGEVHKDSNPIAERFATVTRRTETRLCRGDGRQ